MAVEEETGLFDCWGRKSEVASGGEGVTRVHNTAYYELIRRNSSHYEDESDEKIGTHSSFIINPNVFGVGE